MVTVIDPDSQVEIGLLLHNGGKEEYVWNAGDPLECLLPLLSPMIKKLMENKKQPSTSRAANGREGLSQPTRQEQQPYEVIAEGK